MRLTMQEKRSLTDVTGPRYRKARKAEKTVILNEFCKTVKVKITAKPRKKRYYGHDVEKAVLAVREFSASSAASEL